MENSKILYVRNVDENLQKIVEDYKKKFNTKSEAKVIRRMIEDFPRVSEYVIKISEELKETKKELDILQREKLQILEILNKNIER
ncbi:hypothetical protein [Empedobacter brevis]|uniref:hypothetical protein n=1 Tax=Empedobacter brevis TaxID=247 RepID=UPI003341C257